MEGFCIGIDNHKGVLRPSPTADTAFIQRDIPIHIGRRTIIQVMTHQVPGVNGTAPVILSVSAFLLGLIEFHIGITFVYTFDRSFSRPLETDCADILAAYRVSQDGIHQCFVGTFHGAEHHFHVQFLHSRT